MFVWLIILFLRNELQEWIVFNDEIWLRFKSEEHLKHKDVCLRKDLYYPI